MNHYSFTMNIMQNKRISAVGVAVLSVVMLSFGAIAFAETEGPTHHFKFDEGGGRSAGDMGGANGAFMGSSTDFGWASGKIGTALAMDGVGEQGVALPNEFLLGGEGTLAVWLKMNELSERNILFSARSTSDRSVYMLLAVDNDGRPYLQFRDRTDGNDRKAQGVYLIPRNEWVHLVFTANGVGYRMYVNGIALDIAGDNIGRWFPNLTNHELMYRIGFSDASPRSGSWNGYIDDLRIYGRTLSGDEIVALYAAGNVGEPTIPVAARPRVSITSPKDVLGTGEGVTIEWTSANVDQCSATGDWEGTLALSGTHFFPQITKDMTFGISCTGARGSVSSSAEIRFSGEVVAPSVPATPTPSTSSSLNETERRALIAKIMEQIVALIAELEREIARLQSAAR
jgi:hypothetical protein